MKAMGFSVLCLQEKEAFIISHLKSKGLGLRDEQGEERLAAPSSQGRAGRKEKQC